MNHSELGRNEDEPQEGELLPREIVEKIEAFSQRPSEIANQMVLSVKIEMLLVRAGAKPAGHVYVHGDYEEDGKPFYANAAEILARETQEVEQTLREIGLLYRVHKPEHYEAEDPEGNVYIREDRQLIYFARSEQNLEAISNAPSPIEEGLAFGFPKTAVDAFIGRTERMMPAELPEEIKDSETYPFIQFVLSRDNWQEEIKTPAAWAQTTKKNSPKMFARFLRTSEGMD